MSLKDLSLKPRFANAFKLITKEDGQNQHIHKILGVISLVHFLARFGEFIIYRTISFTNNGLGWFLLFCHTLLSVSSLLFHIPDNRIPTAPMIWPEFRMHSILFALRSLVAIFFVFTGLNNPSMQAINVFATMFLADVTTNYFKKRDKKLQGTTMRAMPFPPQTPEWVKDSINFYYSACQVFATLTIFIDVKTAADPFLILFPIQIAAFMMTLVRKSILTAAAWHVYYALSLAIPFVYGMFSYSFPPTDSIFWICALTVIFLRFKFRLNKYLLWALVGCIYATWQYFVAEGTPASE